MRSKGIKFHSKGNKREAKYTTFPTKYTIFPTICFFIVSKALLLEWKPSEIEEDAVADTTAAVEEEVEQHLVVVASFSERHSNRV